ncbi:MAG: smalltalk protein [Paludibacteraceae bacterium]|nr:smalltalk protein [Paludibacteraceae bacterium]
MNNNENNNKSIWGKIIQIVITVLTAIATTFGVTSCMGL